uniref:C-CAP/cofactor C-like domain-containing protein n=1 Tax=Mucochytrium quahogii TaxID=96639 RepID=A0A7S2W7D6_9STRA|mmetsp:Transcript_12908/g.20484  ORF Transcript_12908/g.20484 Transcript_12908/m.20484 type:complete len:355 (+) Transcript_12908:40-1104(+)
MDSLQSEYAGDADAAAAAQKRSALDKRWTSKLESRKEAQLRKEAEKKSELDPTQDVDLFQKVFKSLGKDVDQGLKEAAEEAGKEGGISRVELGKKLDSLVDIVANMQSELAKATLYLAPYDIRLSSERISKCTADIEQARLTLAPRKKFSFGSKRKAKKTSEKISKPQQQENNSNMRAAEKVLEGLSMSNEVLIRDKDDGVLSVDDVKEGQDVRFENVKKCTIHLKHQTGAVRFLNLSDCKVFIGPVAGSCFFENCKNCTFMIASRQIRIHDSQDCDFYLHVLSRPIIEHCKTLRFAPYALEYDLLQEQIEKSGLAAERASTMWQDVDDFRWLRQQQSPNWCILPDSDRIRKQL